MKKITFLKTLSAALAAILLLTSLGGCGKSNETTEPAEATEPVVSAEPTASAAPVNPEGPAETITPATDSDLAAQMELPEQLGPATDSDLVAPTVTERRDGERFDAAIVLEGMVETVHYEHIRSEALGFEMDYDYEQFERRSDAERECFLSIYDDPEHPENYLEVTRYAEDAETVAAAISEQLANEYDVDRAPYTLDGAGSCIRIDASVALDGLTMPDHLQMVYIIPAADGCRVATAHYFIVGAEGFGRRFAYMMHTFSPIS